MEHQEAAGNTTNRERLLLWIVILSLLTGFCAVAASIDSNVPPEKRLITGTAMFVTHLPLAIIASLRWGGNLPFVDRLSAILRTGLALLLLLATFAIGVLAKTLVTVPDAVQLVKLIAAPLACVVFLPLMPRARNYD